jgi:Tol biopolymer transport system component
VLSAQTISPDGTRVAYRLNDGQGNWDIYVLDLTRGTSSKLTFAPTQDDAPVWSHDSKVIYFAGVRDGRSDLYEKHADGSGEERLLWKSEQNKFPLSASRDGKFLLFQSDGGETQDDLWLLPLDGERKPVVFVNSTDPELQGQISPNGEWIVYLRGVSEITVQRFLSGAPLGAGSKWVVATNAMWPVGVRTVSNCST